MIGRASAQLVERLAAVVGSERAVEIVEETARVMGADTSREEDVERIVHRLAQSSGAIGASVRLLRTRARPSTLGVPAVAPPERIGSGLRQRPHRNVEKLVALLAPSLGEERACELVEGRLTSLGLDGARLGVAAALSVLESLAEEPGLVGTIARFAKARAHLELTD